MLLARCDALVGKFSSNLFRTAHALQAAACDCARPFVSLDAPWLGLGIALGLGFGSELGLGPHRFARRTLVLQLPQPPTRISTPTLTLALALPNPNPSTNPNPSPYLTLTLSATQNPHPDRCSDYGLLEGANWEFPVRDAGSLRLNPFANRLQC